MPAERYYYPNTFKSGDTLILEDQEYHHLLHVMRIREGENVEIVDGNGSLGIASVKKLEKKKGVLEVFSKKFEHRPKQKIILAQGLPRLNRLEFIIEKGTELGVTEFRLFIAAKGEKKQLSEGQLDRMKSITVAAMKQCGRLYLPSIVMMPPLNEWKKEAGLSSYFGDTRPDAPFLLEQWKEHPGGNEVLFFVGPESGFSGEEVESIEKLGSKGVKLHPNILRTDTAGIAALSVISQLL